MTQNQAKQRLKELDKVIEINRNMGIKATIRQLCERNRLAAIAASADKK